MINTEYRLRHNKLQGGAKEHIRYMRINTENTIILYIKLQGGAKEHIRYMRINTENTIIYI